MSDPEVFPTDPVVVMGADEIMRAGGPPLGVPTEPVVVMSELRASGGWCAPPIPGFWIPRGGVNYETDPEAVARYQLHRVEQAETATERDRIARSFRYRLRMWAAKRITPTLPLCVCGQDHWTPDPDEDYDW